jgi:tryptophanase
MFGGTDPNTGEFVPARSELVRIAVPRRVYTNSQLDYVAEVAYGIAAQKEHLRGFEITHEPRFLRHFTCELRPLESVSQGVNV